MCPQQPQSKVSSEASSMVSLIQGLSSLDIQVGCVVPTAWAREVASLSGFVAAVGVTAPSHGQGHNPGNTHPEGNLTGTMAESRMRPVLLASAYWSCVIQSGHCQGPKPRGVLSRVLAGLNSEHL